MNASYVTCRAAEREISGADITTCVMAFLNTPTSHPPRTMADISGLLAWKMRNLSAAGYW